MKEEIKIVVQKEEGAVDADDTEICYYMYKNKEKQEIYDEDDKERQE